MSSWIIYRRLARISRPYWPHLLGLFALTLLAVPLTLLGPLPLKLAVDYGLGDAPPPALLRPLVDALQMDAWRGILIVAVGLMLLVTIVSQLQQLSKSLLNTYVATKLVLRFRSEIFRQVQRLSLRYHDTMGSSDTLYRIQYDATSIQSIVIEGFFPFVVSAATLCAMLYVTLRIDAQLALVALTVVPILMLIMHHYRPMLREQSKEVRKLESSAMSVVQEALG